MKIFNYGIKTYATLLFAGFTFFIFVSILSFNKTPPLFITERVLWYGLFIIAIYVFQNKCNKLVRQHNVQVIDEDFVKIKDERKKVLNEKINSLKTKILIIKLLETPYYKNSRSKFAKELRRRLKE